MDNVVQILKNSTRFTFTTTVTQNAKLVSKIVVCNGCKANISTEDKICPYCRQKILTPSA